MRFLLRLVLLLILLVVAAAFLFGYRWQDSPLGGLVSAPAPRIDPADRERIRETGAAIGDRVAAGAQRAERALSETALTAKIKSKMALDDTIEAGRINVDTAGTTVTLRGSVGTAAERQRALQLARETEGVTSVIDQLELVAR